jgi:hypothetical protein
MTNRVNFKIKKSMFKKQSDSFNDIPIIKEITEQTKSNNKPAMNKELGRSKSHQNTLMMVIKLDN